MSELLHMWEYWRDKYGVESALTEYFPELLAGDPVLTVALAQRQASELAIEARMSQLQDADPA